MNPMNKQALVHIVDDDADARDSLSLLLQSVQIRSTSYPDADSFLRCYRPIPHQPCCLLLDVRMPGLSGMALLEKIHQQHMQIPVIIVTGHGDIPMSVRAMKLGAVDFITKPFNYQMLLELVQKVLQDPVLQGLVEPDELDPRVALERWKTLTPREQEVFEQIATGAANKTISIDLGISIRTVETHRARIMDKLQARSLVDLVLFNISLKRQTNLPTPTG